MEKSQLMKQKIDELSEMQAKNLLLDLFSELDETDELWFEDHLKHQQILHTKTVHIVFGRTASQSLKQAIDEHVITFPDVLSMGPIREVNTWKGMEARFHWFKENLTDPYNEFKKMKRHMMQSFRDLRRITPEQEVVLWVCPNAAERIGAAIVLATLGNVQTVKWINTYEAYRQIEQHDIPGFPRTTGEVTPELLSEMNKLSIEALSEEEVETLKEQGNHWLESDSLLRLKDGEDVQIYEVDSLDAFIIETVQTMQQDDFVSAGLVLGEVYGSLTDYIGDAFLEFRLRMLIEKNILSAQGNKDDIAICEIRYEQPKEDSIQS